MTGSHTLQLLLKRGHTVRVLGRTKMGTGYFFMTGGRTIGGSSGAAARLDMKRTTLQSKMRKLGISRQS